MESLKEKVVPMPFPQNSAKRLDGAPEKMGLEAREAQAQDERFSIHFDWERNEPIILCEQCGVRTIMDGYKRSKSCPKCRGKFIIIPPETSEPSPGGVAPFLVDGPEAQRRFQQWLKKRRFTAFPAKRAALHASLESHYLPYWLLQAKSETNYSSHAIVKNPKKREMEQLPGEKRSIRSRYSMYIDNRKEPGDSAEERKLLKGIEPFITRGQVMYEQEALTGNMAQKYRNSLSTAWGNARQSIRSTLEAALIAHSKKDKTAELTSIQKMDVTLYEISYRFLLLPVWQLSYEYKGKCYKVAMNGQTGKIKGRVPLSPLRVSAVLFVVGGVVFSLLSRIM